jgi:ABC-type transporter Mla MlaB component/anti-sigma regulatory factor (Ser/Thr protein kinase)
VASTDDGHEAVITLAGPYYLHTITRLVRDLQALYELSGPTVVRIDLTRLTFMGPAALALMVASLRRARESGVIAGGSTIWAPESTGMLTYLRRMDALEVLFEHESVKIENPVRRHATSGLKECQHFSSEDGSRRVARELAVALTEKVATDDVAATSLELCLTELAENVHFHADTPYGGFAAAQSFSHGNEIEVAIVDLGVGISASLGKNPQYAEQASDDVTAIHTALLPLVTSSPKRNRGYGLAFTRFLLEMNEGRLVVRSGHGYVQYGERNAEKTTELPFPGTLVALRLHTDRPFDFEKAYELLTAAINEIEGVLNDDVRVS